MHLLHAACRRLPTGRNFVSCERRRLLLRGCLLVSAVQRFWVSVNTHPTFIRPQSRDSGSPTEASLQHLWIMPEMWVPCPKPRLATFIGAQASPGDLKELRVLRKTAAMPTPAGGGGQSPQKENGGLSASKQSCSGS